ncbi:hypothetical protein L226DRAFT_494851 [Lentinus tigrinus ALCF2SS1-7]|uniref:uncharacterized protein n=1 Tax=Lentinus tigrinus ALCF2SS1-7 TaxID=1328758 RepID=UPI00116609B8|nr:hypothetical protein L226DRAFT_494851 [Lentinus tigrinus ALCF2SS1-7]
MVLSLFPLPHHYAIIRTDPEAMVKDLGFDDPETLKEAQGMSRKKYLVYLDGLRGLPVPGDRWCRYYVCPLGTTLRPPDEARGITSDMAIPIAPNKGHTPERHPVHTTPSFPFSNCYHWFLNNVTVRVRIHGDGVEHDGAIYLPPRQQSILEDAIFDDYHRMNALYREKCASPSTALAADASEHAAADPRCEGDAQGTEQPAESQAQNGDPTHVLSEIYHCLVTQLGLRTPSGFPSQSCDSLFEDLLGFDDAQTEQLTVTTVTSRDEGIDLFGWDPNMNIPRIPLVEAWLDLENHLTEDSITSPLELQKEFKQIAELITRGLKRFASARKSPEQIKDQHPVSDAELPPEPGELADNDHWIEVITSLWRDLQYEYVASSSSCDPPFPVLHVPGLDPHDASPFPLHPLPGDVRFPIPDAGGKPSASPVSDGLVPCITSPASSGTRFVELSMRPPTPIPMSSPKSNPGNSGPLSVAPPSSTPARTKTDAASLQTPSPRRLSRASEMYYQLRTKFVQLWHATTSRRNGEAH